MNLAVKSLILDTGISAIITLVGNGSFYSFLFLFVILLLPAILVFTSLDISGHSHNNSSVNDPGKKRN